MTALQAVTFSKKLLPYGHKRSFLWLLLVNKKLWQWWLFAEHRQTLLTYLTYIVDTILRINIILSPAESEAALGGGVSAANLVGAGENRVDMLEIPGKGRCYVYLARLDSRQPV